MTLNCSTLAAVIVRPAIWSALCSEDALRARPLRPRLSKGTMMKRRPVLAALPAPLLALSGPAAAADKTLTVGAAVFPDSLRSGTSSFASLSLMTQTNDLLVARDNKGDLHPALALSWETIDPLTVRFHLRQGVKFSDGVEFTADDVAFTINRVLDPQVAYAQAARISQVQSAVAVYKYTVDVKTKAVL